MEVKISFLGAARNVTGSCYLLEAKEKKLIVDCGLYQERDFQKRNWDPFPVPPNSIDAVLLTHAHLDHCGRLPKLVKEGFSGPIYATRATAEIAGIVLLDSARIQAEDIKYKQKRHKKENRKSPHPYEPLYTEEDVEATKALFKPLDYESELDVADGVKAEFFNAGHIFGSGMIRVTTDVDGEKRSILFTGDLGRDNLPILKDPAKFTQADYILIESTYGDRLHEPTASVPDVLADIVNETHAKGGNIIIPSFAIERTQEVLYHLNTLFIANRIPKIPVFVDSPMAIQVTEVFRRYPEHFDDETAELLRKGHDPCAFDGLSMTRTVNESKAIADVKGSKIIIAGSGMCNGGRVKHHLKANISNDDNTLVFVGYQAVGTLGRHIVDGSKQVRIHGEKFTVKMRVEQISGFSAHADKEEMTGWLNSIENTPRRVFVVHGEGGTAQKFADYLSLKFGWETVAPGYEDEHVLK